jgi:hypothetical protein
MTFNWSLYLNLLTSWMTSGKTWQEAATLAVDCLESLSHLDLSSPSGALIISILTGLIGGNLHQDPVVLPDGTKAPAGPVTSAGQAVALAIKMADEHENQVAPSPKEETPVPAAPASNLAKVGAFLSGLVPQAPGSNS